MRQRPKQVGARAVLIAQVSHILKDYECSNQFVFLNQFHWLEHIRVRSATNMKLDLDSAAVLIFFQDSERIAHPNIVRMIALQVVEALAQRVIALDTYDYRRDFVDMRDDSRRVDQD